MRNAMSLLWRIQAEARFQSSVSPIIRFANKGANSENDCLEKSYLLIH